MTLASMAPADIQVRTVFYQAQEHFDDCEINGSKFAFVHKPIQSQAHLEVNLRDHHVICLAPLQAEQNISIKARSVIILANMSAKQITIDTRGKIFIIGSGINTGLGKLPKGDKVLQLIEITNARHEYILGEFKEGLFSRDGSKVVDSLLETFDAITDPAGDTEDSGITVAQALEFFSISTSESQLE